VVLSHVRFLGSWGGEFVLRRRTKRIYQFDPLGKKQRHEQLEQKPVELDSWLVVPVGHAFVSFLRIEGRPPFDEAKMATDDR
jgi:hypothetical protein